MLSALNTYNENIINFGLVKWAQYNIYRLYPSNPRYKQDDHRPIYNNNNNALIIILFETYQYKPPPPSSADSMSLRTFIWFLSEMYIKSSLYLKCLHNKIWFSFLQPKVMSYINKSKDMWTIAHIWYTRQFNN